MPRPRRSTNPANDQPPIIATSGADGAREPSAVRRAQQPGTRRHVRPPDDGGKRINKFLIAVVQQSTHGVGLLISDGNDEIALEFTATNEEAHDMIDPIVRILERSQWWYRYGHEALKWTDAGEAVLGLTGYMWRVAPLLRGQRERPTAATPPYTAPYVGSVYSPQGYQEPSPNVTDMNGAGYGNRTDILGPDTQAQRAASNGNTGGSQSGYAGPQPLQPGQQIIAPGYLAE